MASEPLTNNYRLISGVFSPDEAREVLMTLIEGKISFHLRNNWSRRELFGDTGVAGEKRINQLLQTKEDLAALIEQAKKAGMQLNIDCNIGITMTPE
jgi:hypothetical protein